MEAEAVGEHATMADMVVNFFTAEDFVGLLSRKAMLPLIVFSILFGFATSLAGGPETPVAKFLNSLTEVMMKFVKIITYYAPIAFFAIFADLVANYGSAITESYGRAMIVYYPLCFVYLFTAFPLFAWFGGGKNGVRTMFRHVARPAIVSLGTCSSVATIPTNLEVSEETGIPKDVSEMVIPLGATMHMDGSCFSCVLKIAFVLGVRMEPAGTCYTRSSSFLGRHVGSTGRRIHRRVYNLFNFLPYADGIGFPYSGSYRKPRRSACHYDKLCRRLCNFLRSCPVHRWKRMAQ